MAFFATYESLFIAGLLVWIGFLVMPLLMPLGLVLGTLGGFMGALGLTLRCRT